jgi:hypothetical protein
MALIELLPRSMLLQAAIGDGGERRDVPFHPLDPVDVVHRLAGHPSGFVLGLDAQARQARGRG